MMAARGQNTSASLDVETRALCWHVCVHTGGGRGYCPSLTGLLAVTGGGGARRTAWEKQATGCASFFFFFFKTQRRCERREMRVIRQRGGAELIVGDSTYLEDKDLVSLDCVEVVIHGQEDQEGSKHGDGGEEMPNVVVVKE